MYTKLIIYLIVLFFVLLILGFVCSFILFRQDRDERKSKRFFSSERLLVFFIEILIAVIGFGITLFITNGYERQIEKEKAIQMLTQTIEYTEKQAETEKAYLRMYDDGDIERNVFLNSSVFNMTYYESILTHELILKNANMNIHGNIMGYLVWIEQATERAENATTESKMRSEMMWRYAYFLKVRNLLIVSRDELAGDITAEKAEELRSTIRQRSSTMEIEIYEGTPTGD